MQCKIGTKELQRLEQLNFHELSRAVCGLFMGGVMMWSSSEFKDRVSLAYARSWECREHMYYQETSYFPRFSQEGRLGSVGGLSMNSLLE